MRSPRCHRFYTHGSGNLRVLPPRPASPPTPSPTAVTRGPPPHLPPHPHTARGSNASVNMMHIHQRSDSDRRSGNSRTEVEHIVNRGRRGKQTTTPKDSGTLDAPMRANFRSNSCAGHSHGCGRCPGPYYRPRIPTSWSLRSLADRQLCHNKFAVASSALRKSCQSCVQPIVPRPQAQAP